MRGPLNYVPVVYRDMYEPMRGNAAPLVRAGMHERPIERHGETWDVGLACESTLAGRRYAAHADAVIVLAWPSEFASVSIGATAPTAEAASSLVRGVFTVNGPQPSK